MILWGTSRPDGPPSRYLGLSRARERMGGDAEVGLEEGLERAVESFRAQAQRAFATA